MHYSTIFTAFVATLQLSSTGLALSIPQTNTLEVRAEDNTTAITPFPFDEANADIIEHAFDAITDIPDSVLDAGEDALKQWLGTHNSTTLQLTARAPTTLNPTPLEPRQSLLHILKCAGAILKAVAENAFPLSKLRRLKELIKFLGGARKVAKMLLRAKTFRQLLVIGGPELVELAEILLGVGGVVHSCFSF
ncbi:hypothetical protein G7Y79_00042g078710 [Physcia stellaris]|nr:hypothetical protein G7Y79_00042g078710 [Physcia stellaris]